MANGAHKAEAVLSGWRGCYAVDLQGDRCVAVRAARVRGKVVCSPVDAGAVDRLAAEGLPVVGVMSERESFTRWVEAPYSSASKARKVFPTLLDIQLPFALDDCLHTFIDVERTPQGSCRGLAAAARRTHVSEKLAASEERGLDPVALDQAGLALWTQALRELPSADPAASRVVVWLDDTHLTLVKGQGGAFVSAHTARAGDTDRVRHLVGASEPGAPPTTWIWSGPAATPERVEAIWQQLGEPGVRLVVEDPATFLVRAIATRALLPGPYRCNLRCGDSTHADLQRRDRRRGLLALVMALGAAVLLAAADAVALWTLKTRTKSVERSVSQQIDALAGYHITARGCDALRAVQDAVQERKDAMAPFVAAMEPSPISKLVTLMESASENGLHFEAVLLSPERTEVRGTSPDWNQCEMLLPILAEDGTPPDLKRGDALASERIPFTIVKGGAR